MTPLVQLPLIGQFAQSCSDYHSISRALTEFESISKQDIAYLYSSHSNYSRSENGDLLNKVQSHSQLLSVNIFYKAIENQKFYFTQVYYTIQFIFTIALLNKCVTEEQPRVSCKSSVDWTWDL